MIESVRRVTLTWPLPVTGEHLTLSAIEAAFAEWISEARGRGASDTARAAVIREFHTDRHALLVEWDAADDIGPAAPPAPAAEVERCVAHGHAACPACSLNDGPTCDGCGHYEATGMHWDSCPNRRKEPPAAAAAEPPGWTNLRVAERPGGWVVDCPFTEPAPAPELDRVYPDRDEAMQSAGCHYRIRHAPGRVGPVMTPGGLGHDRPGSAGAP